MTKRQTLLLALGFAALCLSVSCEQTPVQKENPIPRFEKLAEGQFALDVDDKPYLVLGGQSGNSNNWPAMHPQLFETMEAMSANTLEVPIYWETIEPVEGQYDFSSIKTIIDEARAHDIRLILLWFGTWKNGSAHYMPEWMKLDSKTYFNSVGSEGITVDTPSPHCTAAMEKDAQAFAKVMGFIKDYDPCRTVIMVQVENEAGSYYTVRDYSETIDGLFAANVPDALLKPAILAELGAKGTSGTWTEVFGDRADEFFNAWYVSNYIEYVAAAGKEVYPLPMFINVALRSPFGNPPAAEYESGAATDNVICIYKEAAPHIDFIAPDIYQSGDANYMKVIELYTRPDNALMVPETGGQSKYLYEVISRGIGFSPFGVDGGRGRSALYDEYAMLAPVAGKLAQWRLEGRLFTAFEPENHANQYLDLGEWQAILTFGRARRSNVQGAPDTGEPLPAQGHAMLVKLGPDEYYAFGTNVRYTFQPQGENKGKTWHFITVEEGSFDENGEWVMRRVLNGDQTDWTGPYVGSAPTALRIKLYAREHRK